MGRKEKKMMEETVVNYIEELMGPVPEEDREKYEDVCERLKKAWIEAVRLDRRAAVLVGMLTVKPARVEPYEDTLERLQQVLNKRESTLRDIDDLRREQASVCARIAQAQAARQGKSE